MKRNTGILVRLEVEGQRKLNDTGTTSGHSTFPWLFFVLTYGFSWLIWIPIALSNRNVALPLIAIGGISPSFFGILLTYLTTEKKAKRDFWRRAISFRLIKIRWYILIVLLFPLIMIITFLLEALLGGDTPPLDGVTQTLTQPIRLFTFLMTMLIGGPLIEELGWRGFALERLQGKWNALLSSIILGVIHAAWHLPLFFMKGTSQGSIGWGTILFWLWVIQVVMGSILTTWIYNNSNRSTLSAILVHFMSNSTFTIIAQLGNALPLRTELIRTAVYVAVAVIVVSVWGPRDLAMKCVSAPDKRHSEVSAKTLDLSLR